MTLCIAWIRQKGETEELVFATDSCLTGGEKWNTGIKLFELPRKDCLLCFAGSTFRAYPLILNLVASIKFDKRLSSQQTDVKEILDYLTELFSNLCADIKEGVGDIHELRAEAEFLFGGWSWKSQKFCIWKLYYSKDAGGFIYEDYHNQQLSRTCVFLGDEIESARELYRKEFDDDNFDAPLNMEPLKVLAIMARDKENYHSIEGALQVAKVYVSGTSEFFGVMWPSIDGKPSFLGRELALSYKPPVKYIDPDTAEIIEDPLPIKISSIDEDEFGAEFEFVQACVDDDFNIKESLEAHERHRLTLVLKDVAYKRFIKSEDNQEATNLSKRIVEDE